VSQHKTILHDEDERIERAQTDGTFQMIDREIRLAKKNSDISAERWAVARLVLSTRARSIKAAPSLRSPTTNASAKPA
jgi:hypothetical protein